MTLPVAIVRSTSAHRRPDPIVYLAGGPGDPAISDATDLFLNRNVGGDRDVVLFDQRGTGRSTPSLDCPEIEDGFVSILATADAPAVEHARFEQAVAACRRRLVAAGVDLDAYDTRINADDVDAVRVALGYRHWNLLGISYGTTLALETMRRHPEGIRSVILDSVLPTTVGWNAVTLASGATRVLGKLIDGCAADIGCHARAPHLDTDLRDVIARFDRTPYQTTVHNPRTGAPIVLHLTGTDLVAGLYQAFYNSSLIGLLPSVVELLHAGQTGVIDTLAAQQLPTLGFAAEGMQLSVNCADRQRLDDPGADASTLEAHPEFATLVETSLGRDCDAWNVRSVPRSFNRNVHSDIPTLVFADEYDPVTPPAYGHRAAATLSRSRVLDLPGLGHAALFSTSPCPTALVQSFFAGAGRRLDTSCVRTMPEVHWR